MNKNKLITILMLPSLLLVTGCQEEDIKVDSKQIKELASACKVIGTIDITKKYFEDNEYIVPSTLAETKTYQVKNVLTYTNNKEYIGNDYKIYKVNQDKTLKYLDSENMYDNEGYLFFNTIDYNNVLTGDYQAISNGTPVPYGTNASQNPFTLLHASDFTHIPGEGLNFALNKIKSSLVLANLTYYNYDVPINLNVKSNKFSFDENGLKTINMVTDDYNSVETIDRVNVFVKTEFVLNFEVLEIGSANAKEEIKIEKEKPENKELGVALNNFAKAKSFRTNRHYHTDIADEEETIDVYFNGDDKAIYMAPYDLNAGPRPETPTPADALLVDSKKENDGLLNAYMYGPLASDSSKYAFQRTGLLPAIDNQMSYENYLLPLEGISYNVFDKNEDGSYSPIVENLKYMAGACFVPLLCTTNEIAGDMVTDFKLYLTADKQYIDHIDLKTQLNDIFADITITYDLFNECEIPFNALNNIVE